MEIYTLDRGFKRVDLIDDYESAIWTERYYGDDDFEIKVPVDSPSRSSLTLDTLIECTDSDIPMMLDTIKVEEGILTASGISVLQWMNNRFIRSIPWMEDPRLEEKGVDNAWKTNGTVGAIMANIVQYWLMAGSTFLQDSDVYPYDAGGTPGHPKEVTYWNDDSMGIWKPSVFAIPGLTISAYDTAGSAIDLIVPFGPVFDALKAIGQTYAVGQKITLDSVSDSSYSIGYRNYRGLDRTSSQSVRPAVRFSPELGPLKDIREFQSSRNAKTRVYIYTPELEDYLAIGDALETNYDFNGDGSLVFNFDVRGVYFDDASKSTGFDKNYVGPTGFDMKAAMIEDSDIHDWDVGYIQIVDSETGEVSWQRSTPDWATYRGLYESKLFPKSRLYLAQNRPIKTVDGELEDSNQFVYGTDYNLGDILEIEGYTGAVGKIRVTEYVRSQDATGKRAYPGVEVIE
jgi:hypothetical protein